MFCRWRALGRLLFATPHRLSAGACIGVKCARAIRRACRRDERHRSRGAFASESCINRLPSRSKRAQGRPGAGRTHGPPATKKAGGSHHRFGRTTGLPCAMALRFPSRSPQGPGLIAPVASRSFCSLGISVGMPGPHDFSVRIDASRPRKYCALTSSRPPHPRLTFRDDSAYAPLAEAGCAENASDFWKSQVVLRKSAKDIRSFVSPGPGSALGP